MGVGNAAPDPSPLTLERSAIGAPGVEPGSVSYKETALTVVLRAANFRTNKNALRHILTGTGGGACKSVIGMMLAGRRCSGLSASMSLLLRCPYGPVGGRPHARIISTRTPRMAFYKPVFIYGVEPGHINAYPSESDGAQSSRADEPDGTLPAAPVSRTF